MRHNHIKKYLLLHLEGALSETQRRQVEAHLSGCDECRAAARRLEQLYRDAAAGAAITAPPYLWTRVQNRLNAAEAARRRRLLSSGVPLLRPLLMTAMLILAIGLGLYLGASEQLQQPQTGVETVLKADFYTDALDTSAPYSYFQAVDNIYAASAEVRP